MNDWPHPFDAPLRGEPLLEVSGVSVRFGGVTALDDVSFTVNAGEIAGLIGPNGAGKTTLFNCLSRLGTFDGEIFYDGYLLAARPAHRIAAAGIGRTFQNLALFRNLSVRENILLGGYSRTSAGWIGTALGWPAVRREERALADHADELVAMLGLGNVASLPVHALPFGTQKRVELARALASQPSLLLLDEPAAGLNHSEVENLVALVRFLRDRLKLTVLLVEHHLNMVMRISDRVIALEFGRKIAEGSPAHVRNHPRVVDAYLGTAAA
jgi:branched-chain amino acid transport system ATP-binding protein